MAESSTAAVAANIFVSPGEAFAAIKERPRAWLPLLVLLAAQATVSLVYMSNVDLAWMFETQLEAAGAELTQAQREEALTAATNISPTVYGAIGAVSSSIFILVIFFCVSLYYTGISFATNDGIKLKQWFGFACWCALPTVLGILAGLVNIVAGDARFMMQEEINPLSFANLFSIDTTDASILQRILAGLDLTWIWSMVLSVIGYQAWTDRSIAKSAVIVLGPLAVIVTIGTLLTLP